MSFDNISGNIARCRNIVNAEEHFAADVAKDKHAPQYMFYTPTLANDAHDTNITYIETDLKYLINTMMGNENFMKNTLILVTFDENGKTLPPVLFD
jgi:acid phosphatase